MAHIQKINKGILLSGGVDSTSILHWKKPDVAFLVNYGQVCFNGEKRASQKICEIYKIPLVVIEAKMVIQRRTIVDTNHANFVTPTEEWIPYRNQLIITLASSEAIKIGIKKLFIGSVRTDSIYKDGSIQFYKLINKLINYQEGSLEILAPAIKLDTVELIKKSRINKTVLFWCHSCTKSEYACGSCNSCIKHRQVFTEIGIGQY